MKIYELDGMMYREPLPKGFDFENAVEILSPILEDGTIISSHPKAKDLPKREDGTFYDRYTQDGTGNIDNEISLLIASNKQLINKYYSDLLDEGFEFSNYWITCTRKDQVDLVSIRDAIDLDDEADDIYNCHTFIDGVKSIEHYEKKIMIESLKDLTLEELEHFTI